MKERGRKATVSGSGSSRAAQLAMSNIKDIARRRDRGQDIDEAYLAKVSQAIDPSAAAKQQMAARSSRRAPRWAYGAALAGIGCLILMAGVSALRGSRHAVAGRVLLAGQPLANIEVRFHPTEPGAASVPGTPAARIKTSQHGAFEVKSLPSGSYKVTLHADESGPAIPPAYTDPKSTVFKMKIDRDLTNLSFYAVHPQRR